MLKILFSLFLASKYIIIYTLLIFSNCVNAELTDITQTPNAAGAGINKSLAEQIGVGRGDVLTTDSSLYIIKRDPFRAIRRGRQIFQRKFTYAQGLGPRTLDGVGEIEKDISIGAGLADSCAACHGRPKGSAGFGGDVFTRPDSRDAPHLFGLGLVEMLADEITRDLRSIRNVAVTKAAASNINLTAILRSKGITYGQITVSPNGVVDTTQVVGVSHDLRVRPFFHQGGTISIREFIVGAFNAEMGLESDDPDLQAAANGSDIRTPAGMLLSGSIDTIEAPPANSETPDPDGDGIVNELPESLTDFMEFYLLNYFRPATYEQTTTTAQGARIFNRIGCTNCHIPNLTIRRDRRVADVTTAYDDVRGHINNMYASVSGKFVASNDNSGFPERKTPLLGSFIVEGIYADFKRHDLGPAFWEENFDGTIQQEFMTEALWGVASTAPYGHDGKSININEVILRHGGEAQSVRDAYNNLPAVQKLRVLVFLNSLVLFPPDDTASDLNPGNSNAVNFPLQGHGSISLTVLFNNPLDPE